MIAAIRYHSQPDRYEGLHRGVACVVALANLFCHLKGVTSLGVRYTHKLPEEVFSQLALQREQVSAILNQLDEVLGSVDALAVFQIR